MSAVPIHVTPMPCVLTPVVPILAPAMLDSWGMDYHVKVGIVVDCVCIHCHIHQILMNVCLLNVVEMLHVLTLLALSYAIAVKVLLERMNFSASVS